MACEYCAPGETGCPVCEPSATMGDLNTALNTLGWAVVNLDSYVRHDHRSQTPQFLQKLEQAKKTVGLRTPPPVSVNDPAAKVALVLLQHVQRGHQARSRHNYVECSCGATFWFPDTQQDRCICAENDGMVVYSVRCPNDLHAARANHALVKVIEEFIEWWSLNRNGAVNATYDRLDKTVKRFVAILRPKATP